MKKSVLIAFATVAVSGAAWAGSGCEHFGHSAQMAEAPVVETAPVPANIDPRFLALLKQQEAEAKAETTLPVLYN